MRVDNTWLYVWSSYFCILLSVCTFLRHIPSPNYIIRVKSKEKRTSHYLLIKTWNVSRSSAARTFYYPRFRDKNSPINDEQYEKRRTNFPTIFPYPLTYLAPVDVSRRKIQSCTLQFPRNCPRTSRNIVLRFSETSEYSELVGAVGSAQGVKRMKGQGTFEMIWIYYISVRNPHKYA